MFDNQTKIKNNNEDTLKPTKKVCNVCDPLGDLNSYSYHDMNEKTATLLYALHSNSESNLIQPIQERMLGTAQKYDIKRSKRYHHQEW